MRGLTPCSTPLKEASTGAGIGAAVVKGAGSALLPEKDEAMRDIGVTWSSALWMDDAPVGVVCGADREKANLSCSL